MKIINSISSAMLAMSLFVGSAVAVEYKIEHAMGVANFPDTPQKIVVLTNEGTEALVALGIKPVGASNSWVGDPDFYTFIKADLDGTMPVGKETKINLEAIAQLEPDLIIATKVRHQKIFSQLQQIAPTIASETVGVTMLENLELYGRALGKQIETNELIAKYHARVQKLRDALGDNVNEEISLVRFLPSQARLYQLDSFPGMVLSEIGFKRSASNNVHAFAEKIKSKERISIMDGDRIFVFKYADADNKSAELEQEWTKEVMWKNLSAVKAGKVHQVSDVFWISSAGIISANAMLDEIAKIYNVTID